MKNKFEREYDYIEENFANKEFQLSNKAGHKKTVNDITYYIEFIDDLDNLSFQHQLFHLIDGQFFSCNNIMLKSAKNTLYSILLCVKAGNISDVNILIRKLRDDLFFHLFLIENSSINNATEKNIRHIKKWYENKVINSNFNFKNMKMCLENNKEIIKTIDKFNLDGKWKVIFKTLNNYVHNNGIKYTIANTNITLIEYDDKIFIECANKIEYIISVFTILLILISPQSISSTDYVDSLEMNSEPYMGSQYWVAPLIIDFIDNHVLKFDGNLKEFLNDASCMDIIS